MKRVNGKLIKVRYNTNMNGDENITLLKKRDSVNEMDNIFRKTKTKPHTTTIPSAGDSAYVMPSARAKAASTPRAVNATAPAKPSSSNTYTWKFT